MCYIHYQPRSGSRSVQGENPERKPGTNSEPLMPEAYHSEGTGLGTLSFIQH